MNGQNDGFYSDGTGTPITNLTWLMFTQTGNPGLYMLYSDLMDEDGRRERSILD